MLTLVVVPVIYAMIESLRAPGGEEGGAARGQHRWHRQRCYGGTGRVTAGVDPGQRSRAKPLAQG